MEMGKGGVEKQYRYNIQQWFPSQAIIAPFGVVFIAIINHSKDEINQLQNAYLHIHENNVHYAVHILRIVHCKIQKQ